MYMKRLHYHTYVHERSIPCYHNTIAMLLHSHGTQLQQILRKDKKIKFTLAVNEIFILEGGVTFLCIYALHNVQIKEY